MPDTDNPPQVKYPTAPGSVGREWARVRAWLGRHVPDFTPVGASQVEIDAAVTATGVPWPDELAEFYRLLNGIPGGRWVQFLPFWSFHSLDQLVESRNNSLAIWYWPSDYQYEVCAGTAAGHTAGTYLPDFLPFAGGDAYYLVVDTRPGPLHGCVTEFAKYDADDGGPKWRSLSAMLADLADSLETGTVFEGHALRLAGATLEWHVAGPSAQMP